MAVRLRLVLGDDHHLMVDALRQALQKAHDVVAVAHDPAGIVAAVRMHRPDVLLLDLGLPGKSGIDLIPEVREASPETRIIVVTMHLDRVLAERALAAGAMAFVPKDAGIDELHKALGVVMHDATFVSPRVPATTTTRVSVLAAQQALAQLTPRQHEIVKLIAQGESSASIAKALGLSERTIAFHRANIKEALGVDSTLDLMRYAVLLQLDGPVGPEGDPTGLSRRGRTRGS